MKQFILSIKLENFDKHYSETIVLDKFDTYKDTKEWTNWIKEIYNKVKEKKHD